MSPPYAIWRADRGARIATDRGRGREGREDCKAVPSLPIDRSPRNRATAMTHAAADRPANHLAGETSPYLLQHVYNPVDWYPWGPEALARAKAEDKPIFLSVGYSACHWCHVMERESFE